MEHEGSSPHSQQPATPVPILSQIDPVRSYRRISPVPRPLCVIRNMFTFLRWGVFSTFPNPQAGGPSPVGCPRLFIQYIRSYPPYLEAVPPSATWGRAVPWWQGKKANAGESDILIYVGG